MLNDKAFEQWKEKFLQNDVTKQNEVKSLSKGIAAIKIIIYFIAYTLIATVGWLGINKIETPDLEYLKSYMPLILVVVTGGMQGINFCLKKLMKFIDDKFKLKNIGNK